LITLDTNASNNHTNNSLVSNNNIRPPQTPAVQNNPAESAVTVHHQNGPVQLPIDEPLPSGYVKLNFIF